MLKKSRIKKKPFKKSQIKKNNQNFQTKSNIVNRKMGGQRPTARGPQGPHIRSKAFAGAISRQVVSSTLIYKSSFTLNYIVITLNLKVSVGQIKKILNKSG